MQRDIATVSIPCKLTKGKELVVLHGMNMNEYSVIMKRLQRHYKLLQKVSKPIGRKKQFLLPLLKKH